MYLGIDIGTSSVKAVLVDESQRLAGTAERELPVSRPHPGWSEQEPEDWWSAVLAVVDELQATQGSALAAVRGVGLSGQMHGATLLDRQQRVLRPCILWNDGRSQAQCAELEARCAASRQISGNIAMPGFTAPKLLWVQHNEPRLFDAIATVLLPKDYVRFRLSGEFISDMSDAAGTLWLDTGRRCWSPTLLEATGLSEAQMPRLVEGAGAGGLLRDDLSRRWGMRRPPLIAGGAGDNAASACGIGATGPGDAFISLGTSGVIFVANDAFRPNTDGALHAFCHALPRTWHQMAVILSAASCFDWLARLCGCGVSEVYADLEGAADDRHSCMFLPYLSGERTPHNSASIRGMFAGLDHATGRAGLSRAVAAGVGYAFRDGLAVLAAAGTGIEQLTAVGGGARSDAWLKMLADILNLAIVRPHGAASGAAFGAARLAMAAESGADTGEIMYAPAAQSVFQPSGTESEYHEHNWARYRALYPATEEALAE